MAFQYPAAVVVLLFALSLSEIELSASQLLHGKVSCLDCTSHYDYSGIKVLVKCGNNNKLATATTESGGSFKVELPTGNSRAESTPLNCVAKLIGGTSQMYVKRENMVSRIELDTHTTISCTISTPLAFSTTPTPTPTLGDSKTIDLPLPREWGLAPSSYYVPFFPIIGIP